MITLIGFRCTHSNVLSQEVLIRPFLLGTLNVVCLYALHALLSLVRYEDALNFAFW